MNDIYAVIKLVSGEEIFGQVEEFYDEQVKAIMVIDPCTIKEIPSRRGNFSFYKVDGWVKLSEEPVYQNVDLSKIVTYLVKAVQELSEENQTLKTRLDALENG